MSDGPDAFTILGIGLLIVGGIALLYGHMELMQVQECSGLFCSPSDSAARQWELVRLGGLVLGAIGGVVTFAGAAR